MIQNNFRSILEEALCTEAGTDTLEIEFRVIANRGPFDDEEGSAGSVGVSEPPKETRLQRVTPGGTIPAGNNSTVYMPRGAIALSASTGKREATFEGISPAVVEIHAADAGLSPRMTFERFVVGESNRFAHAACRQVAEPGPTPYNPLVIYGGVGLGKTHLMQAIGHQLQSTCPGIKIVNITSEQFLNAFVDAIRHDGMAAFRERHRSADLILMDDIQFLAGKDRIQEEFHHTFNALYDAKKKIVMTSDRPPREITTLDDRVRNRMHWGLVVDIHPPDLETRMAILMKKAESLGLSLNHEVAHLIADRVRENVRELEGVLNSLCAYSGQGRSVVTIDVARDALRHYQIEEPEAQVSVDDVLQSVCVYFDLKRDDLIGPNRQRKVAAPRHMAMYLVRKLIGLSYPEIGQQFGRDHTSVMHGVRKIESSIESDSKLRNLAAYLTRQCQGRGVG
jgi:chromosomal replication initiator protein